MEEKNRATWPGWETVRLIGRGSFGAVYEIEREVLGEKEKAALKVITIPQSDSDINEMYSDGYDDESITSTFKEHLKSIVAEYSLMRKLNGSANVVNCDDVRYVQHDDGFGWDIFIKMELLTPLTSALPAEISEEQVIKIGKDLCHALVQCKQFGIIHRDIKPQNIFVSPLGDYKLGDFGIAKTVEKTSGGTKIGTYKYMAPEVYNNQPYGAGADIYSLGLVLYWLLNERRMPFLPLPPEKLRAGLEEQARLRRFNGETIPTPAHGSEELKRIVLKACAYDPKARFQNADDMLRALEVVCGTTHTSQSTSSTQSLKSTDSEGDEETATISALHPSPSNNEVVIRGTETVDGHEASSGNKLDQQSAEDDETIGAFDSKTPHAPEAQTQNTDSTTSQKKKRSLIWIALCVVAVAVAIIAFVKGHRVIQPIEMPNPTATAQPADNVDAPTEEPNVIGTANNQSSTIATVLKSINSDQKNGVLIARDENAPADLLFIQRCEEICSVQGIPYVIKTGVWADSTYNAALELVDSGCTIIFSNNPNNEDYLLQAAKQCPEVAFWQADGNNETEAGIDNYHCADFIYGNEDATTEISLVVVHSNNTSNKYIIRTNQAYLGAALRELWLISGDESQYGFFATTVDGEFADDSKQQWWCLTHNGEIVQTGVDDTELISGDEYEFELTTGW